MRQPWRSRTRVLRRLLAFWLAVAQLILWSASDLLHEHAGYPGPIGASLQAERTPLDPAAPHSQALLAADLDAPSSCPLCDAARGASLSPPTVPALLARARPCSRVHHAYSLPRLPHLTGSGSPRAPPLG